MKSFPKRLGLALLAVLPASSVLFAEDIPLTNWTVPPYHSASAGGITTMTDVTPGVPFVGVAPCRLVDTRVTTSPNFPAPYGPPALVAGSPRDFDLNSDPQCPGIPASVQAYSLNITVVNTQGPGFILVYPTGGTQPTVSTLNYVAGQVVANAAIVPSSGSGSITVVAGVSGTDLIIDINGYFPVLFNNNNGMILVGNAASSGLVISINSANTNNSAGFAGFVGPSFTDSVCCGPVGVVGKGAFNGVAGVAQNRATVGVLVTPAGGTFAEGQLGVSGASATQAYGVNGFTYANANADDSAAVLGNALATTGRVYGGRFYSVSTNSGAAGVIGFAAEGAFAGIGIRNPAGVIGIASTHIGVKGIASNGAGEGVDGFMTDGAGNALSTGLLGYTSTTGVEAFGNIVKTGTVSFAEPHPTDATKMLKYIALEGNEAGTYFRGRAKFQNGIATIDVPEDFRMVTQAEGLSIQVTPIGDMASVAVALISLDRIVVRGSRNVEFFYTVNGVRRGYGDFTPIVDTDKTYIPQSADAQMPQVWNGEIRNRLIANGTYKQDGTVNMETAQRLGWDRVWAERERPRPAPQPPSE
ncbi:MAG TPA: hypothetical protein VGA31_04685 [Thermoanaerobaculia bacterium]